MRGFKRFIREHRPAALFTTLVLSSIVMLFFSSGSVVVRPQDLGHGVFALAQKAVASVGNFFSRTVNAVGELRKLKDEHEKSLEKLRQYENMEVAFSELEHENRLLKELLGFSEQLTYAHVPAEVIAKDPENFYSTITISKGSRDGIAPGMPVVAFRDGMQGLVGKVVRAGYSTSLVMPIYDNSCYVAARLLASRYEGLLSGTGTPDGIVMRYVKKIAKSDIMYDDFIVTSGLNSLYPKGIYIGKVKAIRAKDYDTSLELAVEPVVDFSRLEHVFVLKTETGE
jgi:rod shape-determining protein MreC